MPLISVNIPVYNRKEMLLECIDSFKNQTFKDFELVIVDDGSTDGLKDDWEFIFDVYEEMNIRVITRKHIGIASSFNLALEESAGEYIMPFGSDDLALPDLLEETISLMEKYKSKFDVIYTNYYIQDGAGNMHRNLSTKTLSQEDAYQKMLEQQYIPHGGSLWKKEKIIDYDETLESAVDWELLLSALEQGIKFKHRKKKLWIHRTGHPREFGTQRQEDCCEKLLNRRGYTFNKKTRRGEKICN